MTSISLFFNSRKGQKTSENFVTSFNSPLQLNIKKSYEMALISSQIWYSWHNITSLNKNFYYSVAVSVCMYLATCKFYKLLQIFFIFKDNSTRTFLHVFFTTQDSLVFYTKRKK